MTPEQEAYMATFKKDYQAMRLRMAEQYNGRLGFIDMFAPQLPPPEHIIKQGLQPKAQKQTIL